MPRCLFLGLGVTLAAAAALGSEVLNRSSAAVSEQQYRSVSTQPPKWRK